MWGRGLMTGEEFKTLMEYERFIRRNYIDMGNRYIRYTDNDYMMNKFFTEHYGRIEARIFVDDILEALKVTAAKIDNKNMNIFIDKLLFSISYRLDKNYIDNKLNKCYSYIDGFWLSRHFM